MKNLVISVSPDSSLELLGEYADVIVLDQNPSLALRSVYDTVYIRSHFSQPATLPQAFRVETENIVAQVESANPSVTFIDDMSTVDAIVAFEDKWHQYQLFEKYMPQTQRLLPGSDVSIFAHPIFKNRLSSRGTGVTWNIAESDASSGDWIVQESLDVAEELRIYALFGKIYPTLAVRQNKTTEQRTKVTDSRKITDDEREFAGAVMASAPGLDIVGLDVIRTIDGSLYLLEANRSPGFAKFNEVTGTNLADILYSNPASSAII